LLWSLTWPTVVDCSQRVPPEARWPGARTGAGRDDIGCPDRDAGLETVSSREADVERADWLDEGFDAAQAQFLMVTAITHHRVSSPLWGEDEVRKLHAELAEIASAAAEIASAAAQIATPEPFPNLRADRLFS
jgi:hypothetical protein